MAAVPVKHSKSEVAKRGNQAVLFLDDKPVGDVLVKGWDASWGYGDFAPHPSFSPYAPVFGQWSLLMHADGEDQRLSAAAACELNQTEKALDALKVKLFFPNESEWVTVAQLTIDGELLEWKEY